MIRAGTIRLTRVSLQLLYSILYYRFSFVVTQFSNSHISAISILTTRYLIAHACVASVSSGPASQNCGILQADVFSYATALDFFDVLGWFREHLIYYALTLGHGVTSTPMRALAAYGYNINVKVNVCYL